MKSDEKYKTADVDYLTAMPRQNFDKRKCMVGCTCGEKHTDGKIIDKKNMKRQRKLHWEKKKR